jgi:hypothetical protein
VTAGRLTLLGLSEIRQELGPRWAALSDRVHLIAQSVVTKHLALGDVFERHGEDGYVVLFASLDNKEAEFKCQAIRNEIGRQLLGTEWEGLSRVQAQCAEIASDLLARGNLDEILADAFEDRGRPITAGAPAASDPAAEPGLRWIAEPSVWTYPPTAEPGEEYGSAAPGAARSISRQSLAAEPNAETPVERIVWTYAPVWDFQHMALLRFRLMTRTAIGGRSGPVHSMLAKDDASQPLLFETDMRALEKAIGDLASLSANGKRLPAICPIHEVSLSRDSWANQFVRFVRQAPVSVRRLLTIEICGLAEGLASHSVRVFIDEIERLGVACAGCFEASAEPMPHSATPLKAINIELPQQSETEAAVMRMMALTARANRRTGGELGVYGLSSRSLVVSAVGSGFRFLSGDAIHPEVASLDRGLRFELADFYAEFARR